MGGGRTEPVEVPALEVASEHGCDGLDRVTDHVECAVVGEPVELARVGEVLEHAVVVHVAGDELKGRRAVCERRAAARLTEEGLLGGECDTTRAVPAVPPRQLQMAQPLEEECGCDATN